MPAVNIAVSAARKPLRLWPGVILAIVMVLARFVMPAVVPNTGIIGVMAGVAGFALILIWWLFFSRAPWRERVGALILVGVAGYLTTFVVHPSIAGGMMGNMVPIFLLPATIGPLFVAAVALSSRSTSARRWAAMTAAIVMGCGVWALARTDGIKGEADPQLAWRWSPTAEERLLAQAGNETVATPSAAPEAPPPPPTSAPETPLAPVTKKADAANTSENAAAPVSEAAGVRVAWSGFRGANRDGVVNGVRLNPDWNAAKPQALWRRPIGPGWSSFAVAGDLIYTQEQRGEHEVVSAHRLTTGEVVWRHQDAARFYESNGGPGPRGTPTVHNGRVYSMGATGIVNAL